MKKEKWEIEFDKKFGDNDFFIGYRNELKASTFGGQEIKSFIRYLLSVQKQELIDILPKEADTKIKEYQEYKKGFNNCLEIIKDKLQSFQK